MSAAESRELVELAAEDRPRERRQLQHPLLPAQPARARGRHLRRPRRRAARDRPLLPGLAAPRQRLELAAAAGARRGSPSGRRHRLALAGPDDVRHRPARHRGHGGAGDVHRAAPRADRPGRDVLDGGRPRRPSPATSRPRTRRRSCCASRTARAARSASARSAPGGRTRSSTRSTAPSPRSPGTPSSPTRSGSVIAIAPTRS